jgi:hypothetical protein
MIKIKLNSKVESLDRPEFTIWLWVDGEFDIAYISDDVVEFRDKIINLYNTLQYCEVEMDKITNKILGNNLRVRGLKISNRVIHGSNIVEGEYHSQP